MHLDTNIVIDLLNGRSPSLRGSFDRALASGVPLAISIVVYHELLFGAAKSKRRKTNETALAYFIANARVSIVNMDEQDAREAADIRAHLYRQGTPIGPYDVLIAGQARRASAPLVTANASEFRRVPGLTVVDWAS